MCYDILAANYNNGRYLEDFFGSILESKLLPNNIIFVDDCSKDNSLEIVDRYSKLLPIHVVALEKNVGFANALNAGINFCKSRYVARLDPDDYVDSSRFLEQVRFLDENKSVDVVGSQVRYFDSCSKKFINYSNMPTKRETIAAAYYRGDNGVLHGSVMLRRELLDSFTYEQIEVPSEDYAIFSRMLASGAVFSCIDKPLTFVRIHTASVSNDIRLLTVLKVYEARRKYLGVSYSDYLVIKEYLFIKNYRRFMSSKSLFRRFFYLVVSASFGFDRVIRKLGRVVKKNE